MTEEIRQLMETEGNVKGEVIRADLEYIKSKKGVEGLRKVEDRLADLGHPLRLEDIKTFHDYKEANAVLIYVVCRDVFGWDEEDIHSMGEAAAKTSFIVKALLKYFVSIHRTLRETPNFWAKHHDFGELEPVEANEEEKYMVIRVKGYQFHPLACAYHRGYFLAVAKLSIKGKNIAIEETKCGHRGDEYHEYRVTWE